MEHPREEQYSEYLMEGNPSAYMTMRDYRNLPWQWQQPVERNPNSFRSMREYRDQWTSTPSYSVIPTYAPPLHPQYTSLSHPQPPQPISPIEQAILDLTKLVGDAVEEQKEFNAQLSQKIHTVENPLEQKLDRFQSEVGQQFDSLQCSISKLAQQLDHQVEEGPEEECLSDTIVEKHSEQQLQEKMIEDFVEVVEGLSESSNIGVTFWPWKKDEQISALITEEGSGIKAGKEPQKLTLQSIPMKLNPTATKSPLLVAPSTDPVYTLPVHILPSPAAQSTPKAPTIKATPSLPMLKNFKKLVATVQIFATTSKKMAAALTTWHSGWFECRFEFEAPEPRHF